MYRDTNTEYAVLSPVARPALSSVSDWVPIALSSGRSTAIVLVAGQNDTGGLGRASGQSAASKLNSGGFFGLNNVSIAPMMSCTDFSVIANSPERSSGSNTGRSPRRWPISLISIDLQP